MARGTKVEERVLELTTARESEREKGIGHVRIGIEIAMMIMMRGDAAGAIGIAMRRGAVVETEIGTRTRTRIGRGERRRNAENENAIETESKSTLILFANDKAKYLSLGQEET
jgi:hypothetical protein